MSRRSGRYQDPSSVSLSGNLADVTVADVLQFIHLGLRTGTLTLISGENAAEIAFHQGRIVNAWGPGSKRLGELLVDAKAIDGQTLGTALHAQKQEHPRRPLGQILVAMGAVTPEVMFGAVQQQIERTIYDLVHWNRGTFQFAVDDLHPLDDIAVVPGDVIRHLNLDTQMVLLDALRQFDERNRDKEQVASPEPEPEQPAPEAEPRPVPPPPRRLVKPIHLQVVSADRQLAEKLGGAMAEAEVSRTSLRDAGMQEGGGGPVVLVDLRGGSMAPGAIATLRRARPAVPILAMVDAGVSLADVYQAGVIAAVPGDLRVAAACVRSLVQNREDAGQGGGRREHNLARLRRIVGDLRAGLISTTISLTLMNIVSESVERAVLLLARKEGLVAIGAFGADAEGRPLSETARGLAVPLDGQSALADSLADGQLRSLRFDEAKLPAAFTRLLGCPRTGQCAVFPVMGGQRVIALVYADNGRSERPIEELDFLELAVSQAGLAFENELLRRQALTH